LRHSSPHITTTGLALPNYSGPETEPNSTALYVTVPCHAPPEAAPHAHRKPDQTLTNPDLPSLTEPNQTRSQTKTFRASPHLTGTYLYSPQASPKLTLPNQTGRCRNVTDPGQPKLTGPKPTMLFHKPHESPPRRTKTDNTSSLTGPCLTTPQRNTRDQKPDHYVPIHTSPSRKPYRSSIDRTGSNWTSPCATGSPTIPDRVPPLQTRSCRA